MLLELTGIRNKNRLTYQVKYSKDICGYFEEDNIAGTYSKDLIEILEILKVVRYLPVEIRENIIKKILIEEYKHIYIFQKKSIVNQNLYYTGNKKTVRLSRFKFKKYQ